LTFTGRTAPLIRPSVLFVCTANRIRSPLAAALFRNYLIREGLPSQRWRVNSAGTWVQDNLPCPDEVIRAGIARGFDLRKHRSQNLNEGLISSHNLILVMERGHKESLQHVFPDLAGRVYLLSEMSNGNEEIKDPTTLTPADLQNLLDQMSGLIHKGLPRILLLARGNP
jgi:protein-tyrosine-phosphatase